MKVFTKSFLVLLLSMLGVMSVSAKTEQAHATFASPSNTNTTWTPETKTFTWSTTYYNQLRNIGLPTGDLSKYKKLVVDCNIKSGNQFRILFYKGGSNLTLYASDGVNEFILADTLKTLYPNDYNEYLLACDEICLSGNNNAAPGEAVINDVYLETYDDEGEKVYATFESPSNTNTTWTPETKTFTWSTTYYNQLRNIGLPKGDISKYKKLVVDTEIKSGNQFRILFYKGGSNLTLYASNGVNEFILADTLKTLYPNDYNEYLLACDEICLSGNNNAAPGEAVINSVYLETYPENEQFEIPEIVYEEDPGVPAGDFINFTEAFPNLQPRIGIGTDGHPIVLGNGEVVVGQRSKDVIADLSPYSKLTMVTSPNLKLVLYMNHEVDAQQNAPDYAEADAGKYVFMDVQADENGLIEVDLTQFDKQDLNCITLPWDNSNKGTVWHILLTKAAAPVAADVTFDFNASNHATSTSSDSAGDITSDEVNTVNGVTMTITPNETGTPNRYWSTNNGPQLRMYGGTMTIVAPEGKAITKVVFNNGKWETTNTINGEVAATGEWEGNSTNVVLAVAKNTQMNSVVVTLADANEETTTYSPKTIANTAETAYTVAEAIALIDAGEALTDVVFVKGIVSKVEKFADGAITYWISEDGTAEAAQFECYKGKGIDGADFASIDDVKVGAAVVVTGTLTKYGETYEFNAGNKLVSYDYVAPVEYFGYNGKAYIIDAESGKFVAAGHDWGTRGIINELGLDLTFAANAENNKVTIETGLTYGNNKAANHFLGSNLYMDSPAYEWGLLEQEFGFYISDGEKYLSVDAEDNLALSDEPHLWILVTPEGVLEGRLGDFAEASATNPVDATWLIQASNFNRYDSRINAWQVSADCTNKNLNGGTDANRCAESFHSVFTISQTLANAPAGKYRLTAQGFYRQDDGETENAPVVFANDQTSPISEKTGSEDNMNDASNSFAEGKYTIEQPVEVSVYADGGLTIGVKGTATHQWVIFDNFRLEYLGAIPAEEYKPAFDDALAAAKAAQADEANAIVTGEEKTALDNAITTYSTAPETADGLKEATAALTSATNAFTAARSSYQALIDAKAAMTTYSFPYASAEKKAAAEASLTATATNAADATAKIAAMQQAFRQYAESSALLEGVRGSSVMTDSIVNPDSNDGVNGWETVLNNGSGGSVGILSNEPFTDGDNNSTHNYFDGVNWGASQWDANFQQKIALPAGKYQLTVTSRAETGLTTFALFAGTESVEMTKISSVGGLFNRGWNDNSVEFTLAEADSVVIGVHGATETVHNWMSFTRFRLAQFPDEATTAYYAAIDDLEGMVTKAEKADTARKTPESIAALEAAIAEAEALLANPEATTEELVAMKAKLKGAYEALEPIIVYMEFAQTTVFIPTEEAVKEAVDAYWMEHGGTFTNNKTRFINPETDEAEETKNAPGIGLKKGNDKKSFFTYVTGIDSLFAYGSSTGSEERTLRVIATPTEGEAVQSELTTAQATVIVKLALDKTKKYKVEYIGTNAKDEGKDVVLHAVKFVKKTIQKPEYADGYYPLVSDMYHVWTTNYADAEITETAPGFENHIGEELGAGKLVYGNGSVQYLQFADLTGFDSLMIVGTPGMQLRVLLNRLEVGNGGGDGNGGALVEVNPTIGEDGIVFVDLTGYEYAHLNSIKTGWGSATGTISQMGMLKGAFDPSVVVGIQEMKAVRTMAGAIFDLQGRRVAQPARGLYIIEGKKVLFK